MPPVGMVASAAPPVVTVIVSMASKSKVMPGFPRSTGSVTSMPSIFQMFRSRSYYLPWRRGQPARSIRCRRRFHDRS
jgi:hypothetical protein